MDELETRMHTGLTQLAEPMAEVPDLDQVVARGRELRRRRRIAGIAGGAAAVLVVASGVGMAFGSGIFANSGRGPVLATPSPAPSTSPSTSTKPTVVVPGTTDQVVIDSGGLVNELMATQVQLNATLLDDGRYSVQAVLQRGDRVDYQHSATNDGHSITWFQLTSKVVVGFVPHRLNWIQYSDKEVGQPFFSSFSMDFRTFAQFDATVVYRVAAGASGDYAGLRGYLWRGDDGRYYDGDGTLLPSDTYNGATLYFSERLGIFGMIRGGNFTSVEERSGHASVLNPADSSKDVKAVAAALLPAGASKPEVHAGVNGAQIDIETLGGRVLVVATATVSNDSVPLISSITFTDANGKKVSDKG